MSIEKIVGKTAFARLKKEGLTSAAKLKKKLPEEIMSIAAIGPIKAAKLFKSLGKKYTAAELERRYNKLTSRTRFKRVKAAFHKVVSDPTERIGKLEDTRKELIAFHNLFAATRNIGKPQDQRTELLSYAPVSTTIDPFSIQVDAKRPDDLYAEIWVTPDQQRVKLSYIVYDLSTGEKILQETEYVRGQSSVEIASDITNTLEDMYKGFRTKTLTGTLVVILDKQYEADYYSGILDRFRAETERRNGAGNPILIIIPNTNEYYGYESIFRYNGNQAFERMVNRVNDFQAYFLYDKYIKEGGKIEFDDWKVDSEAYQNQKFWTVVQREQTSTVTLNTPGYTTNFGVIKGNKEAFNFQDDWKKLFTKFDSYRDLGWNGYKDLKREIPVNTDAGRIPATLISMAQAVLGTFDTYYKADMVIMASKDLNEIGFLAKLKR